MNGFDVVKNVQFACGQSSNCLDQDEHLLVANDNSTPLATQIAA